jgi:hypothetical protein
VGRLEASAIALTAIALALLAFDALVQPLASWDAWTQWIPKAKALVILNGLDPHVLGSAVYRHWHLDYPLFVPAVEAFAFRFIGIDYRVIHFQQWFLLLGFVLAFVDLLRPRVRPLYLWAVLLAILWAPKLQGETIAANADVPLALFLGLAGLAALIWVTEEDRAALWLLVLFAAAALATKLEAAYLVAIMSVVTVAYVARYAPRQTRVTVIALLVALATIIPWRAWTAFHHLPASYSIRDALTGTGWHDPARGPISTLVVLGQFFSPGGWLLLAPLALAAVTVLARPRLPLRERRWLVWALVAFVIAGLGTTFAVPGPSFPYPWRASDWLLFLPAFAGLVLFVGIASRARGLAAWSIVTTWLMVGMFVFVYIVTPYPFAWHLGTSSARVVIGPELFLAVLVPLLLERAAGRRAGENPPVDRLGSRA